MAQPSLKIDHILYLLTMAPRSLTLAPSRAPTG